MSQSVKLHEQMSVGHLRLIESNSDEIIVKREKTDWNVPIIIACSLSHTHNVIL